MDSSMPGSRFVPATRLNTMMAGARLGNPGPGLLDGIDNSCAVPPSWRTGPTGSGSISTGTHSVEVAEVAGAFAGPSIPSHWHASGPGRIPVIDMPPDLMPLPAHNQVDFEQQFLHATMPSASNFYSTTPSGFHSPMPVLSGFHGPMQVPSGFHTPTVPHAVPSLDQQVVMELQFLRSEIAELKNMILDARYTTLFSAYNTLLRRVPDAVGFNVGPLERANYPGVKFWYLADWSNREAGGTTTNPQLAVAGAMQYIEDQHGQVVSVESVIMMRSLAQNIWFELGITGVAAPSWEQVDLQSRKGYYCAMAASFFNLRLCDLDWKAEKIVQDNYPLWHLRWLHMQNQGVEGSKRVRNASNVALVRLKKSKANLKRKESAPGNPVDREGAM